MRILNPLVVLLAASTSAVASSSSSSEHSPSKTELDGHYVTRQVAAVIITQNETTSDLINQAEDERRTHVQTYDVHSDRWLGPLIGLKKIVIPNVDAKVTVRTPRLKARNEGSLGRAPWYGMAFGLTCTTLAAVMLG